MIRFRLSVFATVLTFLLIMLGAYVRLSDAGLGCPDWPGCYGQLSPAHAAEHIAQAVSQQGGQHGPVSMAKAWKEMVHRYVAVVLGFLVVCMVVLAWWPGRARPLSSAAFNAQYPRPSPWLPTALLAVVCLQGAFGAWTVTLLLKPAIVTGHLLGGMLVLAMLVWISLCYHPKAQHLSLAAKDKSQALRWARLALLVVAVQIALGGWVSTNYAAVICPDFPTCQGQWWPDMQFEHAFHVLRELGETPEGAVLHVTALTAIHMVHRLGAGLVAIVLLGFVFVLYRNQATRFYAVLVLMALLMQLGLGVANVLLHLPLAVAVLHNGGAAALLAVLVLVNYRLFYAHVARFS